MERLLHDDEKGGIMKKIIFLLCLSFLMQGLLYAKELDVCFGLDWQASLRFGIEYRFHPFLGIKADIGISLLGLLLADTFLVVYVLPEDSDLYFNFLVGLPNMGMPIGYCGGMVSLGCSLVFGYRFTECFGVGLRLGAGYPLFFEEGKDIIRDVPFPFGLWPDLVLECKADVL